MARKHYKNVKLEQNELNPTTIGEFENRKKSSVGIFVVMTLFVIAIIFLPQISDAINKYMESRNPVYNPGGVTPENPINPNPGDDTPNYADTFYDLAVNLKIEREDITVDSFVASAETGTLSFKVTNNTDKSFTLEELNYYLELYSEDKTLLDRTKLTGTDSIGSKGVVTLKKTFPLNVVRGLHSLVLVKKQVNEYPASNMTVNQDGTGSLVCSNDHEVVTYKFKDDKLNSLTSEVNYKVDEEGYTSIHKDYIDLATNYNSLKGISSSVFELSDSFRVTTSVDLTNASRTYIFNADTFRENTESKVVKFEMEAQGFSCK